MISPVRAFLGLGSNLGKRLANLKFAIDQILRTKGQKVCRISPVYETSPWGKGDQPLYLNAVIEIETDLPAGSLLAFVKRIEGYAGRKSSGEVWEARELDIDILVYGEEIIRTFDLVVPHPLIGQRLFVLRPFADLAPELVIPGSELTVLSALNSCPDSGEVKLYHEALRL